MYLNINIWRKKKKKAHCHKQYCCPYPNGTRHQSYLANQVHHRFFVRAKVQAYTAVTQMLNTTPSFGATTHALLCTAHCRRATVMCSAGPNFSTIKDTRISWYIHNDSSKTLGFTQHVLTPGKQHSKCKYRNIQDKESTETVGCAAVQIGECVYVYNKSLPADSGLLLHKLGDTVVLY